MNDKSIDAQQRVGGMIADLGGLLDIGVQETKRHTGGVYDELRTQFSVEFYMVGGGEALVLKMGDSCKAVAGKLRQLAEVLERRHRG